MSRQYTKVEALSEEVFRRKAAEETNREIGVRFGLSKEQVKGLVSRQNRKQRLIANGYVPQPKDRPCKGSISEEQKTEQRADRAADAGGAAAKFSVRSWEEVNLKYRVIKRFCEKYPIGSMYRMFGVSRSGYCAWRKRQGKPAKGPTAC